jgi:preprotein translocase subunit SecB
MQTAVFSISNYQFDKVNIDLSNCKSKNLSLAFDVKGVYINESSTYELTFILKISNEEDKENPFITVRCRGTFVFENVSNINEVPDFFYKNSIAILFPYVRAYVSLITTQANIPGIILPTLNLSALESILKKNTTQK